MESTRQALELIYIRSVFTQTDRMVKLHEEQELEGFKQL